MKNDLANRRTFIGAALSLAGLFIFVWMIRIQTSEFAKDFGRLSESYTYVTKTVYPERGHIYDSLGRLLAGSTEVYELGVNLRDMKDPENIADTLAAVLGRDRGELYDLIMYYKNNGKQVYLPLEGSVTPDKIAEIEALQARLEEQAASLPGNKRGELPSLAGLDWRPRLQRNYPEHSLGATVLGFFAYRDRDHGQGYFGIEQKYNHLLAGTPVQILVSPDPFKMTSQPTVPPGVSLVLTIDREIQGMVERVLDQAVANSGSQSGTIVIMDPRNGEILAMASTPRLDLNKYWEYPQVFPEPTPYNRAVEQPYEPGSVFKVLTMAAALDSGVVTPDTVFLDTGVYTIDGVPIYNWDRGAWGPQTMTGCMQHSLNVCMSWLAHEKMGPTIFYSYLKNFGIGHKTGIDLAGEVNYPLSVPGDPNWYPINLGTNSFGQGLAATPIQMITAIAAVANNEGRMMAPHVLKAMIENGEQHNNTPQVIGNPISAETARTLSEMLAVSLEEESSDALVEGYRLAGKTGTAEIAGPGGYISNQTNASFVGWGPVDDPRFIVYVWLEKPTTSMWGSIVAAPVFREVVENLVILMNLPPDNVRRELAAQTGQ